MLELEVQVKWTLGKISIHYNQRLMQYTKLKKLSLICPFLRYNYLGSGKI